LFLSNDHGESWTQIGNAINRVTPAALAFDRDGHIFVGADSGGIFRTTDNGAHWTQVASLGDTAVNALAVHPDGHIFAGVVGRTNSTGGGILRSTDDGVTWTSFNSGLRGTRFNGVVSLAASRSGDLFAGTYETGVYLSTDNGMNWRETANPHSNEDIYPVAANSKGEMFIGGSTGIIRSTNDGASWTQLDTTQLASTVIDDIAIGANDVLYVSTFLGGLYRSRDNGDHWTPITAGLDTTDSRGYELTVGRSGDLFASSGGGTGSQVLMKTTDQGDHWSFVSQLDADVLAVDSSGTIYAASRSGVGVLRSTDDGAHWTAVNNGLSDSTDVYDLQVNARGVLFASSDSGVYRTTDQGAHWTQLNSGLVNHFITPLLIAPNGFLFAGSAGDGVYRSSISTTSSVAEDRDARAFMLRSYPNPASASARIDFSLPHSTRVSLTIFNMRGEKVATLVDASLAAGEHRVVWNAEGFPASVYLCRLQTGDAAAATEIVVLAK
jgi:photosystem II stability/assembly factor-like uncharacterized protein